MKLLILRCNIITFLRIVGSGGFGIRILIKNANGLADIEKIYPIAIFFGILRKNP